MSAIENVLDGLVNLAKYFKVDGYIMSQEGISLDTEIHPSECSTT
jgi:hypothetical protein